MKRWDAWGEEGATYELKPSAVQFLRERLGDGIHVESPDLGRTLGGVPAARLAEGTPFETSAEDRLRHARGHSFPDWLAMRFGDLGPYPDGVAYPKNHDEAVAALDAAKIAGAIVIPYGGGTSVVGHLAVPKGDRPVISISLERMNRLMHLGKSNWLARFGAGTPGPEVERQLAAEGFVLGHFPQSWEFSTVGGWVVTRSSGQQSLRYGRVEQFFDSGRLITPRGELNVGGPPASSAGPDLREFVMGSEGRLGLLTEAVVRVRPLPEHESFHAVFFPDWDDGFLAMRDLAQSGLPLSMLRLSNPRETETQLVLAGGGKGIAWLERYLSLLGVGDQKCMMMLGVSGTKRETRYALGGARTLVRAHDGAWIGTAIGKRWAHNRFHGVYIRNAAWDMGYAIDTVETAVNWNDASALMSAVEKAAQQTFIGMNERVHAFTHLSHVYRQGCSVYSTFVFRAAPTIDENMDRWRKLKKAVSDAIVSHGGTISHQHGVGVDHAPYLPLEKGPLGMSLIKGMARELDPDGMMNPGKLFA